MRNTRHNPVRTRAAKLLTLALLIASSFSGCMNDGGTELPNEVRGTLYTTNGSPAVNATVTLYPVSYTPSTSAGKSAVGKHAADPVKLSVQTDASGQFAIPEVPEGEYNILAVGNDLYAFQDSITVTGQGIGTIPSDTLRAAGTLTGSVQLQPQHSPQTATVQVLGTDYYTNVAADGRFTLTLPRGNYRLRVSTILVDYVPLFVSVAVRSGIHDTLAEPLEPFYANIPVVTGLVATPDSTGGIRLRWNKPRFGNVQKYLIYRDSIGTIVPSVTPYKSTTDTFFSDIIYARIPVAPQLEYFDPRARAYTYRVRILDVSDNLGPVFGFASDTSSPPERLYVSGAWVKALENAPFPADFFKLAVFQNKLWVFPSRHRNPWHSEDGVTWTAAAPLPMASTAYISAVIPFQGKLWVISQNNPSANSRNDIWNSTDGVSWSKILDSLPFPNVTECNLQEFGGEMWLLGGGRSEDPLSFYARNVSAVYHSADGLNWTNANPDALFKGRWLQGAAVHNGNLWISGTDTSGLFSDGSGTGYGTLGAPYFTRSGNGSDWNSVSYLDTPDLLLPRKGHAMLTHQGKLWIIGGFVGARGKGYPAGTLSAEVWGSPDGVSWQLHLANAPFGGRTQFGAASFKNKLWVVGGTYDPDSGPQKRDVWYSEDP